MDDSECTGVSAFTMLDLCWRLLRYDGFTQMTESDFISLGFLYKTELSWVVFYVCSGGFRFYSRVTEGTLAGASVERMLHRNNFEELLFLLQSDQLCFGIILSAFSTPIIKIKSSKNNLFLKVLKVGSLSLTRLTSLSLNLSHKWRRLNILHRCPPVHLQQVHGTKKTSFSSWKTNGFTHLQLLIEFCHCDSSLSV